MTSVIIHYEILKLFCSEKIYGGWWYVPIIESNSRSRPETWEWPWVSCPLGSWSRYGPDSRPWAWQYGLEPANWSNRTIAGQLQHILVYPILSLTKSLVGFGFPKGNTNQQAEKLKSREMKEEWWWMKVEWWRLNDEGWLMKDEWCRMNDESWIIFHTFGWCGTFYPP